VPPSGTCCWPLGLARSLAIFAANFTGAMPAELGSPTSSAMRARIRVAISHGVPNSDWEPVTSRNASSSESGSTSGV